MQSGISQRDGRDLRTGGIDLPETDDLVSLQLQNEKLQKEMKRLLGLLAEQETAARLLIQRDLALSKANEKLEKLDQAKSEFVSVAAHQLRTPLSGIKWGLDILVQGEAGELNDEQRNIIQKSIESNDRMIALVNDLLDVDHIEAGKDAYRFASVDIREVVDSVLSDLKPKAEAGGVMLRFEDRFKDYPHVWADKSKLRAVIQNLVENAVRYIMNTGTVSVRVEDTGAEMLQITVADDGIGIPKEAREKIFGKFFRAENAVRLRTDGSGLGLFIASDIVKKHGGNIWFEEGKTKGTSFFFTIPKAK
ncbi:MAG TPA: HAMP domain-containing sensor histidine kinase [Candidatus Paceibacterota bacterium]|nr:HAMP domain-containing sensor histidine kinase [Candidatus Paceibacterota bacterium]